MSQKTKRFAYPVGVVVICGLLVGFAMTADGGFLIVRDRAAWEAGVGGLGLQFNFDTFTGADVSFQAAAYNFGSFSLEQVLTDDVFVSGRNFVDVDPFAATETINGTPYANMFMDGATSVRIRFSTALTAWGADFLGGGAINFDVSLANQRGFTSLGGPLTDSPSSFFGFISDSPSPLRQIVLRYDGPTGGSANVLMDNIALGPSVPEPTSLVLFATGVAALGAYVYGSRRRRGRREKTQPDGADA